MREIRESSPSVPEFLATVPVLDMPDGVADLAAALIKGVPIPPKAAADAAHIGVAAYHRIDFLMTWNLAHIANAELRRRIEAVCVTSGYAAPILCTPDELMGEERHAQNQELNGTIPSWPTCVLRGKPSSRQRALTSESSVAAHGRRKRSLDTGSSPDVHAEHQTAQAGVLRRPRTKTGEHANGADAPLN
jgi:hypothetical protein